MCRRSLGASVTLNPCNAAKKSCAGLSDTSCIRSIPSHLFFTALNAFIATGAFWLRVFSGLAPRFFVRESSFIVFRVTLCWAVVFDCCLQAVVLLGFCIHYENQPIGYVLVYRLTASQSFYVIKAIYRVLYIIGSDLVFGVTFV